MFIGFVPRSVSRPEWFCCALRTKIFAAHRRLCDSSGSWRCHRFCLAYRFRRGEAGRENSAQRHRTRTSCDLRQKHLSAVQRLAAGARLVGIRQRTKCPPQLVVRGLRLWIRDDRVFRSAGAGGRVAFKRYFECSSSRRISMPPPLEIFDHSAAFVEIVRTDRRFAMTVRDIEHIGWLAQA